MRLPALLTADLHLVADPSCEYRWRIFEWLAQTIKEEKVRSLCLLGDLTDKKDYHPSELVNRIVFELNRIPDECDIFMIPGNHEWMKEGHEFFKFLRLKKNVRYFTEPSEDGVVDGVRALFLPFTKTPAKDWAKLDPSEFMDYVFMHQTIAGAISSNGMEMEGEDLPDLKSWPKIYSGDIHVPQKIGPVEYVGSPYHVHFGDNFIPRTVLIEKGGRAIDLHMKSPRRVSIKASGIDDLTSQLLFLKPGDHVKVTIELTRAEKHEWTRIRREASDLLTAAAVHTHGLALKVRQGTTRVEDEEVKRKSTSGDALLRFVEREELTADAYEIGMEIIDDYQKPVR